MSKRRDASSLETEIEQTRERLAGTIDELIQRTSPKTFVTREMSSMRHHFVDPATGGPRTDNILKVAGGVIGVLIAVSTVRKLFR